MLIDQNKKTIINDFIKYINTLDIDKEKHIELLNNIDDSEWYNELQDKWYKSLEDEKPYYDVYDLSFFLIAGFDCFIKYSRNYIKLLYKNEITNKLISSCKTIIDVGNGTGHSTKCLRECFSDCEVYGTNILDSYQYKHNIHIGNKMIELKDQQIDCFILFDFMEHIEAPVEYINNIINKHKPKVLIFANSFNTECIGHFKKYKHNDMIIDQSKMSRFFNNELKKRFKKVEVKFWNNRPQVYSSLL
tara:strand:- start:597 stop:1334 length:738 start_codon:yes stop_codon:yes gene_type:complete